MPADEGIELTERESDWTFWPKPGEGCDTGGLCDCGHEGLGPEWHVRECPAVGYAWRVRAKELHDALWELKERWPKIGRRRLWDLCDIPDWERRAGLVVRAVAEAGVTIETHYSDHLSDD